jgi:uncharacterized protein (DUF1778 family)
MCAESAYNIRQMKTGDGMLPYRDNIGGIEERSTERMSFRTKPRIKETIQKAAALSGVDDSVFTMNAAYKAAVEMIAAHEHTMLEPVDHEAFFAALDRPAAPTEKLRAAFAHHREMIEGQ